MKRHANIPVFIPHLGCPNQCVFCNQRSITGVKEFSAEDVRGIIENALSTIDEDTEAEIAFFGGSFTGIDYGLMCELLEVAYSYIKSGRVSSIRCSTRPDYINTHILDTLKRYGVATIELGLQSSSDSVLNACKRGHTAEDERAACHLITEHGFNLVGQMMIGLPGANIASEEATARFIAESGACAARIYPTVVFRDTELCRMTELGEYAPLSVEEAVKRSARVFKLLKDAGVDVIRIGLCASENLSDDSTYFAGPNHSAIGELVVNEYYFSEIKKNIIDRPPPESADIFVSVGKGALSKAIGQKRINKLRLGTLFSPSRIFFKENEEIAEYAVRVEYEERKR